MDGNGAGRALRSHLVPECLKAAIRTKVAKRIHQALSLPSKVQPPSPVSFFVQTHVPLKFADELGSGSRRDLSMQAKPSLQEGYAETPE